MDEHGWLYLDTPVGVPISIDVPISNQVPVGVPLTVTAQQLASRYTITMSARVELRDTRDNKVLWENPGLIFRQEYDAQGGAAGAVDPTAFFGQDQNALDRMTTEFARSIVSAILEAF